VSAFATSSEPILAFAFWIGVGASGLVVVITLVIIVLRAKMSAFTRRRERFIAQWRPLLVNALYAVPDDLPVFSPADTESFLILWNHLHETVRGDVTENLAAVAMRLDIPRMALLALAHGNTREKLLAIVTLGHLHERNAIAPLGEIAASPNTTLALFAAKALVCIDPVSAANLLLPLITTRTDWPPTLLSGVLAEAGKEAMSVPLARCIREAPSSQLPRLSHLLRNIEPVARGQVVHELHVRGDLDTETISQCLQALTLPVDAGLAVQHSTHPSWYVRVQAAATLGRIGAREHLKVLERLLTDPEWWVRYRAAQAVVQISALTRISLSALRGSLTDRYARDMLDHVVAEGTHR
jgi:hypothetical protein